MTSLPDYLGNKMLVEKKISEMTNSYRDSLDLIKVQDEYIEFIECELDKVFGLASIYSNLSYSINTEQRALLRDKIKELKEKVFLK